MAADESNSPEGLQGTPLPEKWQVRFQRVDRISLAITGWSSLAMRAQAAGAKLNGPLSEMLAEWINDGSRALEELRADLWRSYHAERTEALLAEALRKEMGDA